ncbi:hypothetical protein [Sideroxyarcus sp. TK5]
MTSGDRYTPLLLCGMFIVPQCAAAADDFESYRRQQQQGIHKQQAEFQSYREQQDADFADFLKARWREFDSFHGKVRIKEPKPAQIPVAPGVTPPRQIIAPKPVAPVRPAPPVPSKPSPVSPDTLRIDFYGNPLDFSFDPAWQRYRSGEQASSQAMSAFWMMMSGSRYAQTLQAVNMASQRLKLDDWGRVSLWRAVARSLQPGRKTEQSLLLWYFLIKSGYDVRLGYAGNDVYLFVAVRQPVYATKFTRVGEQTYYAVLADDRGDSIGRFYTYEASYPVKLKALDIGSAEIGFTREVRAERSLSFDYKGQAVKLSVPYDRNLVEYLEGFPQSEFALYFDTDGSSLLRRSVLAGLRAYTENMKEQEAVNFLLAFVQRAFAYKTDNDQFGREKYFFIEESLYFPYNDCEDRSVLFAWLVRELTGLKVIGLLYPGHMTTAVALTQPGNSMASVEHLGQRFVIADPTYIGATVGMAMPAYAATKPSQIVAIRNGS